jgi:hypothetical protein
MYHSVHALQNILKGLSAAVAALQSGQAQLQDQIKAITDEGPRERSGSGPGSRDASQVAHDHSQRIDELRLEVERLRQTVRDEVRRSVVEDADLARLVDAAVGRYLDANLSSAMLLPADGLQAPQVAADSHAAAMLVVEQILPEGTDGLPEAPTGDKGAPRKASAKAGGGRRKKESP